jgi:DNA-binding NarL/FixJ family response regulator
MLSHLPRPPVRGAQPEARRGGLPEQERRQRAADRGHPPRGLRAAVHHPRRGRADGRAAGARRQPQRTPEAPLHERLSHREYQVFRLLAAGRSVGEIAEQLVLSSNTVSTYRARILEKTGVRNDVELALYAVRQNLQ